MSSRIYSYTNSYEPFSRECITDDSPSIPTYLYERCIEEKQRLPEPPYSVHEQFCQPIILRCTPGRPIVPKDTAVYDASETPLYGCEETYLYVYGRRPFVAIEMKDQSTAWQYARPKNLQKLVDTLRKDNVQSVVDAKLTYKRPYIHAAAGSRYMIKLYFGGVEPPQHWRLRQLLQGENFELSTGFENILHNSSVTPHTQWYIANRASIHGEIEVTAPINAHKKIKNAPFLVGTVFYKDVRFVNDEEMNITEDDANAYTRLLTDRYTRIISTAQDEAIADLLRSRLKNVRVPHGKILQWRQFKKSALYPAFITGSAHSKWGSLTTALIIGIRSLPGYSTTFSKTEEGLMRALTELCRLYSDLRTEAKQFWNHELRTKLITTDQKRRKERRLLMHTNALRWGFLDIEVSFVPHCSNEDLIEVNLITFLLWDHGHSVPSEAIAFVLLADERKDNAMKQAEAMNLRKQAILNMACKGLQRLDLENKFEVRYFLDEKDLLVSILEHIRRAQLHILGHYNGTKYDLPFIKARSEYLDIKMYQSNRRRRPAGTERPRRMEITLTHRRDFGTIRYRRKMPKKNHRAYGVEFYAKSIEKIREETRPVHEHHEAYGGYYDECEEDDDEYSEADYVPIPSVQAATLAEEAGVLPSTPKSPISAAMVQARQIMSIAMHNIALLDVMLEVGDRNRGCKLDVASKTWLNLEKIHDERVSYENLTKTWRYGDAADLEAMVAYCLRDTLLTALLARRKQISAFYMGDSALSFMNLRELFLAEMVKSTISTQCGYGYWLNVVMPDSTLIRDERPLWVPGYDFVTERDMGKLSPPAGRTVQNGGFYDLPIVTTDFAGQYPSIQRSKFNVCSTSCLRADQAALLSPNDYYTKTLYNARPVTTHDCEKHGLVCQGTLNGTGDPRRCKYSDHFEPVEYIIYFTTPDFFRGLVPQSLDALAVLRKEYKKLMSEAKNELDRGLYDALQLSVKVRMNGAYGVTLRLTPLVGTTITQYGREQTESVARKGVTEAMMVVNGDTDSVMLLDKSVCEGPNTNMGRLSRMSRNLCQGEPRAPVSKIFSNLMEKHQRFCAEVNATLPAPCALELEKIFLYQRMDEKKCYLGEKILPGSLALVGHRAGMTGLKGDKTEVKAAAQFITGRMSGIRDFDGLALYARHLYDAVSIRLRAHEIAQTQVDELCDRIDIEIEEFFAEHSTNAASGDTLMYVGPWRKDARLEMVRIAAETSKKARADLAVFDGENHQQGIETQHSNGDAVPVEWMTSTEKVGDVADPVTLATKVALRNCKRNGVGKHNAPLFVKMIRKHEVQVSAPIIKSLEVLLRVPEPKQWQERREMLEENELGTEAWQRERKRRQDKETRETARKAKFTKLTITAMPNEFVAPPSDRAELTERERAEFYAVIKHIRKRDAIIQSERKGKFADRILEKPPPLTEQEAARLRMYILQFKPAGLHAPLWWYDEEYCETRLEKLDEWCLLPHQQSACDLWSMYVRTGMARRFLHVRSGMYVAVMASDSSIEDAHILDCDDSSWDRDMNIHPLPYEDEKARPKTFTLDMRDRYAHQTRATPFIVTSTNDKHRYLTNKDSFCPNQLNRFSFAVHLAQLMIMARALATGHENMNALISFRPINGTRDVCVSKEGSEFLLNNVTILRDDKRSLTRWYWDDPPFYVRRKTINSIFSRLNRGCMEEQMKSIDMRFNGNKLIIQRTTDVLKYNVPCSILPERVPVLTLPTISLSVNSVVLQRSAEKRKRSDGKSVGKQGGKRLKISTDVKPRKQMTLISFLTSSKHSDSEKNILDHNGDKDRNPML